MKMPRILRRRPLLRHTASWRIMIEAEASRHGYIPLLFVPIRIDLNASRLQWSNGNKNNQPIFSFNIFKHKKIGSGIHRVESHGVA